MVFLIMIKDLVNLIKVKRFLKERLDLGFELKIERAHCVGATAWHLFQN